MACATKKGRVDQRSAVGTKLRNEGVESGSTSIKRPGGDGKVGRKGVTGYIGAAETINSNCLAPVVGAVDDLSATEISGINQRRTTTVYLCNEGVVVSARVIRLEGVGGGKRAYGGTTDGPSCDVCVPITVESDASTKVIKITAKPRRV